MVLAVGLRRYQQLASFALAHSDPVKVLLEVNGLTVEDYSSTADFVESCHPPACGCLVLDRHLLSTIGIDFVKSTAGKQLGIPVILITGRHDPALEQLASEAGVVDYLQSRSALSTSSAPSGGQSSCITQPRPLSNGRRYANKPSYHVE